MAEFTKGPWTVHKNGRIVLAGGIKIYQSSGPGAQSVAVQKRHDETLKANARLIAAAPELYEALKRIKETGVSIGAIGEQMMNDALNKADGK